MKIQQALTEIEGCERRSCAAERRKLSPDAVGALTARAMLVGEAPGKASIANGEPWTGKSGQLLRGILSQLGGNLALEQLFYITDVAKCCPKESRKPTCRETRACKPFLGDEVRALKPAFIVTLGTVALGALLDCFADETEGWSRKVTDYHGTRSLSPRALAGFTLFPVLHPSNVSLHIGYRTYTQDLRLIFALVARDAGLL